VVKHQVTIQITASFTEPIPAEREVLANFNVTVVKGLKLAAFFIAYPMYAGRISLRLSSTLFELLPELLRVI
jgi:hypothetical protein